MTFKRRTQFTYEDFDNPWYISVHGSSNGKNYSIVPTGYNSSASPLKNAGSSVLPNCFSKETHFVSDQGIRSMEEMYGKHFKVFCADQQWHDATVEKFGQQQLYQVMLGKHIYFCTGNHRWITYSQSGKSYNITETSDLKPGQHILYSYHNPISYPEDAQAILHGFIFGDGCFGYKNRSSSALLCGLKQIYMDRYIGDRKKYIYSDGMTVEVPGFEYSYKYLPSLDAPKQYLYNFVKGYFAADGTCSPDGTINIDCINRGTLEHIRDILYILEIKCGDVRKYIGSGYNGLHTMYSLPIYKICLTSDFFINTKHRNNFNSVDKKHIKFTTVKSIEITDRIEDVYCVVEPDTHTFTLAGGELTCNCTGYAWGRFSEIMGRPMCTDNTFTINAGEWVATAKATGKYKTGTEPKVGAVIEFSPQHVAIVEAVNADGTIDISESGWPSISGTFFQYVSRCDPHANNVIGYIYNPNISGSAATSSSSSARPLRDVFVSTAKSHIGSKGHTWVKRQAPSVGEKPWGAAMIGAVAKEIGCLDIIPLQFTISTFTQKLVEHCRGTYIKGTKNYGEDLDPEPGDIFVIQDKADVPKVSRAYKFKGSMIGIVQSVTDNGIKTVEGNTSGGSYAQHIRAKDRSIDDITYFIRPNWGDLVVTDSGEVMTQQEFNQLETSTMSGNITLHPLFDSSSTRADASIREIGYMTLDGKPSLSSTSLGLSVTNYTNLLSSMVQLYYDAHQDSIAAGGIEDDTSKLQPEAARLIVKYFKDQGYPTSLGIGLLPIIENISNFKTNHTGKFYKMPSRTAKPTLIMYTAQSSKQTLSSLLDRYSGCGLLNWIRSDASSMQDKVGKDWKTNLSKQLDFIRYQWLNHPLCKSLNLAVLFRKYDNSEEYAKKLTEVFCKLYYSDVDKDISRLKDSVSKYWSKVVVSSLSIRSSSGILTGNGGSALSVHDFPAAYNSAPVCSLDQLKKALAEKHGISGDGWLAAMGWISGGEIAPKASGGYDHYWGYLSACTGINNCKNYGGSRYLAIMNGWGGWYSNWSLQQHINQADDMYKKYMYLAIMYLDTRVTGAHGVVAENGYDGPSISSALYSCPDIRFGHQLPNGSWVGPGGIFR